MQIGEGARGEWVQSWSSHIAERLGVEGELGPVREPIAVCPVLLSAGCIEGNKVHSGLSQHISTTNEHLSRKEKSLVGYANSVYNREHFHHRVRQTRLVTREALIRG